MNKQFVLNTIKDFESWEVGQCVTFRYKSSNKVEYELTIKKEEPKYFPFIVTVTGTRTGTPETIGRRYTSVERAFCTYLIVLTKTQMKRMITIR